MTQNPRLSYKEMIQKVVSQNGAQLYPKPGQSQAEADENLALWVDAYFPRTSGKHNRWTLVREAFRVRAELEAKALSSNGGLLAQA